MCGCGWGGGGAWRVGGWVVDRQLIVDVCVFLCVLCVCVLCVCVCVCMGRWLVCVCVCVCVCVSVCTGWATH
jgi:hypothetical protein